VDRVGFDSRGEQMLHDAVGAVPGAGEDQRARDLWITQRSLERPAFVGVLEEPHRLVEDLGRRCSLAHGDAHRVAHDVLHHGFDLRRHPTE
jgi:hypothetical protein